MDEEGSNCVQLKHVLYDIDEEGTDDEEGFVDGLPHQSNLPSGTHYTPSDTQVLTKKLTSEAWVYFEQVKVDGVTKAMCKKCKKLLCTGGNSGTSHLVKHGKTTCPMRHLGSHVGQKKLRVQTNLDGSSTLELKEKYKEFNQEISRSKLVNMVVIHEYPLSIVDHYWFRDFIKSINPSFKMISRNTLKTNILNLYNDDKLSLKQLLGFNESRVAVTTDMWTASNQKKGYMVVTSHFIDRNWVLRNRTLRFCFVPCPHTKGVLAKVLMDCLSQYCLESKISSVVVDNCSTNDAMMKILLKNFESKCLILKGRFLHLRCSAHILNLIVKDGLNVIELGIVKVRNCVSFWMSTPKRIEKFEEASLVCEKLDIFDNATKVFSGRHYPTSNLFFRKACEIKLALMRWLEDDHEIIQSMAKGMIEKFDKYWEHINGLLAIAAILDPRNKMDCVSFYFKMLYGEQGGEKEVERVRGLLDDLVVEYQKNSEGNSKENSSQGNGKRKHSISHGVVHQDAYAKEKETKTRKVVVKGEVEHYLEDQPEGEDDNFDVLSWWKIDRRYPTLRTIAKDILAIPISSVASESAFSMGGRVVSAHRSKLHANTVEALMCLQNWKMQDYHGDMEGTSTTINEDSEVEGDIIDKIDMDVDDIPIDDMEEEEEELYDLPCIV